MTNNEINNNESKPPHIENKTITTTEKAIMGVKSNNNTTSKELKERLRMRSLHSSQKNKQDNELRQMLRAHMLPGDSNR